MTAFRKPVTTEAELRDTHRREPSALALAKELGTLDVHCRDFIARSPFLLLATSSAAGRCDVSPKGDAPGFVLRARRAAPGDPRPARATSAWTACATCWRTRTSASSS